LIDTVRDAARRAGISLRWKPVIPITALTAHVMSGDRDRFLASAMVDFVSKPIDAERLYLSIWTLAASKRNS
jgi:CheY-like chemotaxis protein